MFGIAENVTGVIQNSMKQWKTELTAGNHYWVKCVWNRKLCGPPGHEEGETGQVRGYCNLG